MKQFAHKNYLYFPRLILNTKQHYYYHFECINDYFGLISGFFNISIPFNNEIIKYKLFVQFNANYDKDNYKVKLINHHLDSIQSESEKLSINDLIKYHKELKSIFNPIVIKIDTLRRPSY